MTTKTISLLHHNVSVFTCTAGCLLDNQTIGVAPHPVKQDIREMILYITKILHCVHKKIIECVQCMVSGLAARHLYNINQLVLQADDPSSGKTPSMNRLENRMTEI